MCLRGAYVVSCMRGCNKYYDAHHYSALSSLKLVNNICIIQLSSNDIDWHVNYKMIGQNLVRFQRSSLLFGGCMEYILTKTSFEFIYIFLETRNRFYNWCGWFPFYPHHFVIDFCDLNVTTNRNLTRK